MRGGTGRPAAWLAGIALVVAAPALARAAAPGAALSRVPAPAPGAASFTFAPFGTVHVYAPPGTAAQVVLFVSGDGGWNLGVVPMARRLQAEGALVVGIDIRTFLASLERSGPCAYPAGSLEELSRAVQLRYRLHEYRAPILVGYSSGATLVYAALAQAPRETFRGAISLGFCPDVSLRTPLCRGRGLVSHPKAKAPGADLEAFGAVGVPWSVLQGEIDQVCAPADTARFVGRVDSGRLVSLPKVGHGFSVTPHWEPQYVEAYRRIAAEAAPSTLAGSDTPRHDDLAGLGLVEVPARGPEADLMAVMVSGDGGWAEIDKRVSARLAAEGIPVVGWSSLKYYWTPRTPETAAKDLARVLDWYGHSWKKRRFLLVGYSFGADVLPFLVSRLPAELRSRVALLGLVGLSEQASFEFHVVGWLGIDEGHRPTAPEVARLGTTPVLCLRGDDEDDSACRLLHGTPVHRLALPGGHHFGGNYERIAEALLAELRGPARAAPRAQAPAAAFSSATSSSGVHSLPPNRRRSLPSGPRTAVRRLWVKERSSST